MATKELRLYKDLSWVFPIMTPLADYKEECESFFRIVEKHSNIDAKTLLHLGCGGGHHDYFYKKQYKVTGVDISKDMLRLAEKLNPECEYIQGDMRSIKLKKSYDVITAGDAAVYMLSEKDLYKVFANAYRHLKPGGLFMIVSEYNKDTFEQNKIECMAHKSGDMEVTCIENQYDADTSDSVFEIVFVFLIRKNGRCRIETDHHKGGIFTLNTWRRLLKKAGFKLAEKKFTHSSFPRGYYLPMFLCAKSR